MQSYSQLLEFVTPEEWDQVNRGAPITVQCPDCGRRHSVILLKYGYERQLAKPEGEQSYIACPCVRREVREEHLLDGTIIPILLSARG